MAKELLPRCCRPEGGTLGSNAALNLARCLSSSSGPPLAGLAEGKGQPPGGQRGGRQGCRADLGARRGKFQNAHSSCFVPTSPPYCFVLFSCLSFPMPVRKVFENEGLCLRFLCVCLSTQYGAVPVNAEPNWMIRETLLRSVF